MKAADLAVARRDLMAREGTEKAVHVAGWSAGDPAPAAIPGLLTWAEARGISGVVWTALPSRFDKRTVVPSIGQVLDYLRGLEGEKRMAAEEYIRRAPHQVDTPYRRAIEAALGWTPLS